MELEQALRLIVQLLVAVHGKDCAHGDLNPHNILIHMVCGLLGSNFCRKAPYIAVSLSSAAFWRWSLARVAVGSHQSGFILDIFDCIFGKHPPPCKQTVTNSINHVELPCRISRSSFFFCRWIYRTGEHLSTAAVWQNSNKSPQEDSKNVYNWNHPCSWELLS